MNLGEHTPSRLLGAVDIDALVRAMDGLDASAWQRNTMRQQRYQVHRWTQSIVFAWTENDWRRGSPVQTQRFEVDAALDAAAWNIARQVVDRVGGRHVSKLMLAKLLRFIVDDARIGMRAGELVEINDTLVHAVENASAEDRVHLISDVLPAEAA